MARLGALFPWLGRGAEPPIILWLCVSMEDQSRRARLAATKLRIMMELAKRRGIKDFHSADFDHLEKIADRVLVDWEIAAAYGDRDTETGLFNGLARQYHAIQKEIDAT